MLFPFVVYKEQYEPAQQIKIIASIIGTITEAKFMLCVLQSCVKPEYDLNVTL